MSVAALLADGVFAFVGGIWAVTVAVFAGYRFRSCSKQRRYIMGLRASDLRQLSILLVVSNSTK